MLKQLFTDHPASVNETYFQHMGMALSFSGRMALAAAACFVHAFLPFLFVKTGSSAIDRLHDRMVINRRRVDPIFTADQSAGLSAGAAAERAH